MTLLPLPNTVIFRAERKSQIRQCMGFCKADILSSMANESAEQKPKPCLAWDFLSALAILSERHCVGIVTTHRLDALLEPVDVFLEEVQRARLAAVPRERRRARRVDRVHPVLQLNLARRLQTRNERVSWSFCHSWSNIFVVAHIQSGASPHSWCFVLFSFGSSGYQLDCIIAAVSAQPQMEHVTNTKHHTWGDTLECNARGLTSL